MRKCLFISKSKCFFDIMNDNTRRASNIGNVVVVSATATTTNNTSDTSDVNTSANTETNSKSQEKQLPYSTKTIRLEL